MMSTFRQDLQTAFQIKTFAVSLVGFLQNFYPDLHLSSLLLLPIRAALAAIEDCSAWSQKYTADLSTGADSGGLPASVHI